MGVDVSRGTHRDISLRSVSRRAALAVGLATGGAIAVQPSRLWAAVCAGETGRLSAVAMRRLELVCDTLIPDTETPGAARAGVHVFVGLYLTRQAGADGVDGIETAIAGLAAKLDELAGGVFVNSDADKRFAALHEYDAAAFTPGGTDARFYRQLKRLALIAYYTSKVGASEELCYAPDPGRFDADVPAVPNARSFFLDHLQ